MGNNTVSQETARKELASGLTVTWVGIVVNVALVILKITVGLASRSQALLADGVHSLSDLFSDVVVLFGLKWGRKEEDAEHPFGHARIETVSSMLVGIILIVIGVGIAYNAVLSIYRHDDSSPGLLAIGAAVISIVLKEWMYWYTVIVGRRIRSLALIGNAWHHRSDALSSIAVLIGVGGAYLKPSWNMADSYAALVVTFFIMRIGYNLIWLAAREVVDTAPDKKIIGRIADTAFSIEGVRQVHDIRARHSGSQIFVEMHIVVDPNLTVRQGHAIAKQVEYRLFDEINDVTRVMLHVDPDIKTP